MPSIFTGVHSILTTVGISRALRISIHRYQFLIRGELMLDQ